jgi:uncharacterized protein (DUF1015 family)
VLEPFRALRYAVPAERLARLTSPPYDVIDEVDVGALEAADPANVVRLIRPRDPDRYARAASTLAAWRAEGTLRLDREPALYVYELASRGETRPRQRGLIGALRLAPPEDGVVLPHENTMAGPVADRLALYTAVAADLEPIVLLHAGPGAARDAVAQVGAGPPLVDVELPDALRHRLWALTDREQLADVARDLAPRTAVIADGHHRYATYLRRQADAHAAGRGAGPWDLGLTFLVDAEAFGPDVHAIHRVLPGVPLDEILRRSRVGARITPLDGSALPAALQALADAGRHGPAYLLVAGDESAMALLTDPDPVRLAVALPSDRSAAWRSLDVSVLHGYLVTSLWGLPDDVEAVHYEHDPAAAIGAAGRTGGTAVLLNPTPVAAVTSLAAGGERMPRKSTLFTPKPRSGLVIRPYA